MIDFTYCLKLLVVTFLILGLPSCATRPVPFDVAARNLANDLLREVQIKSLLTSSAEVQKLVMDDFTDEDTGEVVAAGEAIETIIFAEAKENFRSFSLSKMDTKNIRYADYLINGVIALERIDRKNATKFYHVFASVTDLKTGKVIANAASWISDRDLDYTPLREYQEAPMYMADKRHKSKVKTARSASGIPADEEYYNSLETNALLAEASTAYGEGNYRQVILMLNEASTRDDGQVMKTYAGLYQAHLKEDNIKEAEDAFGKLVGISVENDSLSVKLLFRVNSTDFILDNKLRSRYRIWLRQISKFFNADDSCAKIIGHSSHTGAAEYNNRLSKARADAVQRNMQSYYRSMKQKTETYGMGFRENIKGLGTDDGRDAIDRRVEFKIVACSELS